MRDAIFVLGMGRSGTSALTHVLSICGAALPRTIIAGNQWNPRGYWEPANAVSLNDAFLLEHGSSWYDPHPVAHDVPLEHPSARTFIARIAEFLHDEYPADGTIIIKDPRISGLFPFWRAAAELLGFRVKVVLALRHPDEVSASLLHRDAAKRELSQLLWLKYNLLALSDANDLPHVIIDYPTLLADWQAVATMCIGACDLDLAISDAGRDVIDDAIDPGLRNHRHAIANISDHITGGLLSDAFVALLENRGRTMEAACIGGLTRRFRALPEIAAPLPDTHAFGALIATTRMIGSGDGIRAENGEEVGFTDTAEIDMRSPFFLRGWALRTDGYVAVDRVIVTINGGTVAGAISEQRGDIVQLYGRQAGLAGFIARVPGQAAQTGQATLEIHAICGNMRTTFARAQVRQARSPLQIAQSVCPMDHQSAPVMVI